MGRFVSTYLVDLKKIEAAIGSEDGDLLQAIAGEYRAEFEEDDTTLAGYKKMSCYEALEAVIDGGPFRDECLDEYVMAIKPLSEYLSERELGSYGPYHGDWLEETLDEALAQLGVGAVETSAFEGFGEIGGFGLVADGAGAGIWTHEECRQAVAEWNASTLEQRSNVDDGALAAIEGEWMDWASQAAQSDGMGIIGWFTL
ncbi:DUF7691 family protein [Nocardia goodfellowii]